ncbi:MAG: hypothetical protein QM706_17730 [Nitrospira sp.]
MAVTRQIIAVTGIDKSLESAKPEIYTICFNYGVSDYSWRWRPFPASLTYHVLDDQNIVGNQGKLPNTGNEILYVNTLGIREDTTLYLRGFKKIADGQKPVEGRWFQKYLPADFRHFPHRLELEVGIKPKRGFEHAWDFITEEAFQNADHFFSFGVYEKKIEFTLSILSNRDPSR